MSQYKTTNGRPANFKFGSVNIRVGKKPVEIDSKYAERILKQYPGWIERVGPAEIETEELKAPNQEAGATAETAGDDHPDANLKDESQAAEKTEPEASTQETEATAETTADDQPDEPAAAPVPAATPSPEKKATKKSGKKAAEAKA